MMSDNMLFNRKHDDVHIHFLYMITVITCCFTKYHVIFYNHTISQKYIRVCSSILYENHLLLCLPFCHSDHLVNFCSKLCCLPNIKP